MKKLKQIGLNAKKALTILNSLDGKKINKVLLSYDRLLLENKKATTVKYKSNHAEDNSSISSRTMAISGTILLVFLITHLSTVWYTFQIEHGGGRFFAIITGADIGLGNIFIALLFQNKYR